MLFTFTLSGTKWCNVHLSYLFKLQIGTDPPVRETSREVANFHGNFGNFSTGTYAGIGTQFVSSLKMLWKVQKKKKKKNRINIGGICIRDSVGFFNLF